MLQSHHVFSAVAWREDFKDLHAWQPLNFPKIKVHSVYQAVTLTSGTALRCESDASASGLLLKKAYDVEAFPILRFEWKVESIYEKSDPRKKSGDDYPLRLYVFFPLQESKATWLDRLARSLYGQYPPHSALNYVWSSKLADRLKPYASPYTSRARMIPLQSGAEKIGQWIKEEVNVVEDYRLAFGTSPPEGQAQLAIMNDSDNTKLKAVSQLRFIEASSTLVP
jgi:Protein of unknown function (DUF3047)